MSKSIDAQDIGLSLTSEASSSKKDIQDDAQARLRAQKEVEKYHDRQHKAKVKIHRKPGALPALARLVEEDKLLEQERGDDKGSFKPKAVEPVHQSAAKVASDVDVIQQKRNEIHERLKSEKDAENEVLSKKIVLQVHQDDHVDADEELAAAERRRRVLLKRKQQMDDDSSDGEEEDDLKQAKKNESSSNSDGGSSSSNSSSTSSSSSSDEESEEETRPRIKFVRKNERKINQERAKLEREEKQLEEVKARGKERKRKATKELISKQMEQIEMRKQLREEQRKKSKLGNREDMPDDTDGVDEEAEYHAWEARELRRLTRDREKRMQREQELAETERRRNMTDAERAKEDAELIRLGLKKPMDTEPSSSEDKGVKDRYYHKGAFYLDK